MGSRIHIRISRRIAVLGGALLALASGAKTAGIVKILFVCEAGTVKSPIAREHARRLAAARGLGVDVRSRGIAPEDHMTPQLAAALAGDRIDIAREPVLALTAADLSAADVIVVFNPLPPALGAWSVRDWTDTPSMNEDYGRARGILIPRIDALLDEVAKGPAKNLTR